MPLDGLEAIHNCADTAVGIAEQIVAIYSAQNEWLRASEGGRDYVRRHYSISTIENMLVRVM
jgi:hypothetical protein